MPAIVTHHLFGEDVLAKLGSALPIEGASRDAFLLGNIGPDPLFFLKATPSALRFRNLGTLMHVEKSSFLIAAIHRRFIARPPAGMERELGSFALGFLCHYLLDSSVHPLVYAQQHALCDAGIEGLTRENDFKIIHTLAETELDEYALTTRRGLTVAQFAPHRETLKCPDATLGAISAGISDVAARTYGLSVPRHAFSASVVLYRAAQRALDSGRDGLRSRFDYTRVIGRAHRRVNAMTHTDTRRDNTPFANLDHLPWPHPFDAGQVVDESFDDLYDRALERAVQLLPSFMRADFTQEECFELTGGVNFSGEKA